MIRKTDIYVFQKVTQLAPFYEARRTATPLYAEGNTRVNLVLTFGLDDNGALVAKINCPVNPLPVKGEFYPAGKNAVLHFLRKNGWECVYRVSNKVLNM
ncbi:hypothetical protein B5G34_00450 [Flavonifractor sp. An82]|uniref:hypothetical protein n=1 Tax=Flavonifractor sp. An82 TaxID=1965660 RepID=UPI000B3A26B0|nr:hypothetical protein [Flavonifractor sp. An82]OUN23604.1 hypothetical protein B5G34_00450 [Flavonifractor sp. An82]